MSTSTRVIKLKLLKQLALVEVETSARTFGEFKAEISNLDIDWSSAKLIDRASKVAFELDEAVLPATDAVMFVMPTKSKAGADLPYKDVKALVKDFKATGGNVPFNYTQATTGQLNSFWDTVKQQSDVVETITNELQQESEEVVETITLTPGTYKLVVEGGEEPVVIQYVDNTTLEDLATEASKL